MNKDTFISILSDMHSGGSTALFPNKIWWFDTERNHTPSEKQKAMFAHFERCAQYARANSRDKRHIIIHDGDSIEGTHHNTIQIVTPVLDEQAKIHMDLMRYFMKRSRFDGRKGDKLYYVQGTETHTREKEREIAEAMKAQKSEEGNTVFDFLELEINGRLLWFLHHGKSKGRGPNDGNSLRNWLRDVYFDCQKAGTRPPDVLISGHTHTPVYNVYVISNKDGYHMMHGLVCPSWQAKTRYAWKQAPTEINEVGAVFLEIRADGEIRLPVLLKMETEQTRKVVI